MTILYKDEDIIVKQSDDGIYAGYKRGKLYKMTAIFIPEVFVDGYKCRLTYKKGSKVFTDFKRKQTGIYYGVWVDGVWYYDHYNGRYVNYNGEVMREAWFKQFDESGNFLYGCLLGFTKEV